MENENDFAPEETTEEETVVETEQVESEEEVDWKSEAIRQRGIAKRNATKLQKLQEQYQKADVIEDAKPVKSNDLGYGEKAFLLANGIKNAEEVALVKDYIANTGKSLDDVLTSKYFQAELKDLRDTSATREAIPQGSKRSSTSGRSTVDYWIAKGELPPESEVQLRRDVVNAKIKSETHDRRFSDSPIISSV